MVYRIGSALCAVNASGYIATDKLTTRAGSISETNVRTAIESAGVIMKAKEFLRQYEYADKRAKRLQAEYERELELIDSVRSTLGGDGMPHGSGVSRRTEDAAIRLADKAMRWKMAQVEAIEKRQEVFELIHDVEGTEGEILYERYINLRRWEDICVVIHLSWRQTHRLHGKALNLIEEKMALNGTL